MVRRDLRRNNRSENTAADKSEHLGPNFTYAEAVRMFNVSKTIRDGMRTTARAIIFRRYFGHRQSRRNHGPIKPYTAVGLTPTVRGIRKRADIRVNL
jgi:hypothetical protein